MSLRRAFLVAQPALEGLADAGGAAILLQHPRDELERRLMTHVLAVPALEVRDPRSLVILTETHDQPIHRDSHTLVWVRSIDIVIRCEPAAAKEVATSALEVRKFRINWSDEWTAVAERGSKIANAFGGALAQYLKVGLSLHSGSPGETIVRFEQASSGAMGGIIGVKRTRENMETLRDEVSSTFQEKGLLVAVNDNQ